jgi:transposase-like protein
VGRAGEPEHGVQPEIYAKIEAWWNRGVEGEHPYLYLDGIAMKRTWAGEVRNISLLVAALREILGICEAAKEDKSGWSGFLRHLVDRGLKGVQLIISDACRGLTESVAEYFAEARWQRCMGAHVLEGRRWTILASSRAFVAEFIASGQCIGFY